MRCRLDKNMTHGDAERNKGKTNDEQGLGRQAFGFCASGAFGRSRSRRNKLTKGPEVV